MQWKIPMKGGFNGKLSDQWSIFQPAMFDYQRLPPFQWRGDVVKAASRDSFGRLGWDVSSRHCQPVEVMEHGVIFRKKNMGKNVGVDSNREQTDWVWPTILGTTQELDQYLFVSTCSRCADNS